MIVTLSNTVVSASNMERQAHTDPYELFDPWIEAQEHGEIFSNTTDEVILHSFKNSVESFLSETISRIAGIKEIMVRSDSDFLKVWVMIDEPSIEIEDQIYAEYMKQLRVMPGFPVDLSVMYGMGRTSSQIAPQGALSLYRA